MAEPPLQTPVALAIFSRPELTARVFAAVRRARPARLLLIADGPRPGRPEEARLCREARAVVEGVDWPCEVCTEYSDVNLGCRGRLSSGLDWVFDSVEEAIVLEDDCLPHPAFFRFSEELLGRYRDDERVMHVSGNNFSMVGLPPTRRARLARSLRARLGASYYFSRYAHVWGWATWRHAWRRWHGAMEAFQAPEGRRAILEQFSDPGERSFWESTWDRVAAGEIDSWAYQWTLACLWRRGLAAMPRRNLVSNIGFGTAGLHTTDPAHPLGNLPLEGIRFPLRHPRSVSRDERADARTAAMNFGASPA